MRLLPKISKSYQAFAKPDRFGLKARPWLIPLFGLVLGAGLLAIVLNFQKGNTLSTDSHVVFLFDNGKQETVDTKAATVGDLVKKLPLGLVPQDVVEPSLKTPIIEDNFRINIYRARPVTVVAGGERTVSLTGQRSARVIAADAGLQVYPEDAVSFAPGDIAQGVFGEEVVVTRSKPVYLNLYGTALQVRTLATTVAGLLEEKQIKLSPGDQVKPGLSTVLTPKTQVFVLRQGTHIVTVAETIPAPTQTVNDPGLTFGVTAVRQPGQDGKRLITYEVDKNGHRIQIQAAIVEDPVPQIVARGTNVDIPTNKTTIMADAGLSPSDYQYANYIVSNESGWCYTKWQGEYGSCPAYHGAPNYGGYGLCQATPPQKMSTSGADWAWNPVTQMKWCDGYAQSRYGGWAAAYSHWIANHNW